MDGHVIFKIYPRKTIEKISDKIRLLGVSSNLKVETFLSIRLIFTIFLFLISLFFFKSGYIIAPIVAVSFYVFFELLVLDYRIQKRSKKLEKDALFFFEIFTLTIEAGRNLKHALDLTVNNVDSELSLEFKKTLTEVHLGKSLSEALEAMKKRIPSDTINNAILNMIQSDTFGNSILVSMHNQIDFLRNKQMLEIKGEIAKLPTKVSIISVIFFVPIMLFIILAPILIEYLLS